MNDQAIEIIHEEEATKGCYHYTAQGAMAASTYSKAGEHLWIIDHTEVPDGFRGQGIGLKIITRIVDDARAKGKKILPLCPFAAAQFRKHPEWHDVLSR